MFFHLVFHFRDCQTNWRRLRDYFIVIFYFNSLRKWKILWKHIFQKTSEIDVPYRISFPLFLAFGLNWSIKYVECVSVHDIRIDLLHANNHYTYIHIIRIDIKHFHSMKNENHFTYWLQSAHIVSVNHRIVSLFGLRFVFKCLWFLFLIILK